MLARSRSMPLVVAGLQMVLFIGVAAPDVFGVKGWRWMAGLAHLGPFLSPVAQLIGLALVTRKPGNRNVRAQR
jgi:hypothetical protein